MKKRLVAMLLVVCTALLVFTACGDAYDYDLNKYLSKTQNIDFTKISIKQGDIDKAVQEILQKIKEDNATHDYYLAGADVIFTVTVKGISRTDKKTEDNKTIITKILCKCIPAALLDKMDIKLDYSCAEVSADVFEKETVTEPKTATAAKDSEGMIGAMLGAKLNTVVRYITKLPADYEEEAYRGAVVVYDLKVESITRNGAAVTDEEAVVTAKDVISYTYEAHLVSETALESKAAQDVKIGETTLPDGMDKNLEGMTTLTDHYFYVENSEAHAGKTLVYTLNAPYATLTTTATDVDGNETISITTFCDRKTAGELYSVKADDVVTIDYSGVQIEKTGYEKETITDPIKVTIKADATGMESVLAGAKVGGVVKYQTTLPEDYEVEEYRGKTIVYYLTVKEATRDGEALEADAQVQVGDEVSYTYEGRLVLKDPFEGGTAENYELTIGSGAFITGFEDGLKGVAIGNTEDLLLTFPDDYKKADNVTYPEGDALTIEMINTYLTKQNKHAKTYESVAAWREAATTDAIKNLVYEKIAAAYTVVTYPKDEVLEYGENLVNQYKYYASSFGTTLEALVTKYFGYADLAAFYDAILATAKGYVKSEMILVAVAREMNIELTDEDYDAYCEAHYAENGYESKKKFIKTVGKKSIRLSALCEKVTDQFPSWAQITPSEKSGDNA